jgi:hypothetical protein
MAYAFSEMLEAAEISNCCRRSLVTQEARFQERLTELTAQLTARDNESNKLRYQMEDLQRDVLIKGSGMDREYLNLDIVSSDHYEASSIRKVP